MSVKLDDATSHAYALDTLNILNQFQDFLDNIKNLADMGCGIGNASHWWANLTKHDGTPRDIKVNAVDINFDSRFIRFYF